MKRIAIIKTLAILCFSTFITLSCKQNVTDEEQAARDDVGKVYDSKQQGVDIENRDNQSPSSRNDNKEGYGQSLGAPSDTVDNDGDKKIEPVKQAPR